MLNDKSEVTSDFCKLLFQHVMLSKLAYKNKKVWFVKHDLSFKNFQQF